MPGDLPRNPPSLRILVAEDNAINQVVILSLLERLGQRADLTHNGREALEACQVREYDLLFMDCHMPEMDGFTASNRIRLHEDEHAKRPVFIAAMTADVQVGTRERCEASGMNGFITKPILIKTLQDMIYLAIREAKNTGFEASPVEKNSASPWEDLDLRVLDRLRILSEDDESGMFLELVTGFLTHSAEKTIEINKLIAARDFPGLGKAAHGLKGLALNFGALAMSRECDALQRSAGSQDTNGLLEPLGRLEKALIRTRTALTRLSGLGGLGWDKPTPVSRPEKKGSDD